MATEGFEQRHGAGRLHLIERGNDMKKIYMVTIDMDGSRKRYFVPNKKTANAVARTYGFDINPECGVIIMQIDKDFWEYLGHPAIMASV